MGHASATVLAGRKYSVSRKPRADANLSESELGPPFFYLRSRWGAAVGSGRVDDPCAVALPGLAVAAVEHLGGGLAGECGQ